MGNGTYTHNMDAVYLNDSMRLTGMFITALHYCVRWSTEETQHEENKMCFSEMLVESGRNNILCGSFKRQLEVAICVICKSVLIELARVFGEQN